MKKIVNANIITPYRIIKGKDVAFEGGKIVKVDENILDCDEVIDANGLYLSPGFIDLHIHGGGGFTFETSDFEEIKKAAYNTAMSGTTTALPSLGCQKPEDITSEMMNNLKALSKYIKEVKDGPELYGIHFEGPYLFEGSFMSENDPLPIYESEFYEKLIEEVDGFKIMTIAADFGGAKEFVRYCVEHNIFVSLGHGKAPTYEQFMDCVEAGANQVTHIYSSMAGFSRIDGIRYAGDIESALMCDDVYTEVISNGVHLSAPLLNFIYKNKGSGKICLATDSHPRKEPFKEGEEKVIVFDRNGKKTINTMASMDYLLRYVVKHTDIPFIDAVKMATINPAKAIKIDDRKGKIGIGYDADLVLFDEDINIKYVVARGEEILNNL